MLGPSPNPRPEYAFCGCGGPISIGMASDRDEIQSSTRSGGRLVLPDMPPGDPPLQDTALRFRRTFDERGVAILWLMQNPLYGQLDAGAIWNRTFNEFVTRQGPPATSGTSSSHTAEIEAVQA